MYCTLFCSNELSLVDPTPKLKDEINQLMHAKERNIKDKQTRASCKIENKTQNHRINCNPKNISTNVISVQYLGHLL